MKKLLLILTLLLYFGGYAQDSTFTSTKSYVNKVEGKTKSEIFSLLNKWVALNYNSANNVVQLSDAESGNIIVKGINSMMTSNSTKVLFPNNPYVLNMAEVKTNHVLDITCRDGRFKIIYTIAQYGFNLNTKEVDEEYMKIILKFSYDMPFTSKKKEANLRTATRISMLETKLGIISFIEETNKNIMNYISQISKDEDDW